MAGVAGRAGEAVAPDGTVIPYEILSRGDRPDRRVALVHSLAMNRDFWRPVAERLAVRAEVLIYDCRGHGAAGRPPGPYTVDLFADDLAALFDAASWDSAAVAGASMGGCVALAFAARHAARTRALGLVDCTAWYGDGAATAWEQRGRVALVEGMEALFEFQAARWFSDGFRRDRPEVLDAALDVFRVNDPKAYVESCRMLGAMDLRGALGGLRMPVGIVVGAEDYGTPPSASEAMRAAIADASLRIIPGARHLTPLEVPDVIAAEIGGLLDRAAES